jgi:hypothetical protein
VLVEEIRKFEKVAKKRKDAIKVPRKKGKRCQPRYYVVVAGTIAE